MDHDQTARYAPFDLVHTGRIWPPVSVFESEYKYHSNKLTVVEIDKKELGEAELINAGTQCGSLDGPCWKWLTISERESTWYVSGDKDCVSALTEITVDCNRTPVITSHPPPPFTSITGVFAGTLSKDVLSRLQPVSFLGKKKARPWQDE